MKNIFLKGLFVIGIGVVVLAALYYKESNKDLPLSEIFPEEHPYPVDIEYVDQNVEKPTQPVQNKIKEVKTQTITKQIPAVQLPQKLVQTAPIISKAIDQQNVPAVAINAQKFYSVQISSLKDQSKAEAMIQSLKKKSFESFLKIADVKDKGAVYRVYVGNFATKEKAENFLQTYKKDFSGGFIVAIK